MSNTIALEAIRPILFAAVKQIEFNRNIFFNYPHEKVKREEK